MVKKLIPIIGGVVLLAAGLAAGMFLGGGSGDENVEPVKKELPTGILEMETFLANISDPSGERFAKLSVKLAISPENKILEITADPLLMAKMRDRVLTLLTSKSFEDLSDPMGKEAFRSEIRMRLSPLLAESEIKEVLFGEFVVQ